MYAQIQLKNQLEKIIWALNLNHRNLDKICGEGIAWFEENCDWFGTNLAENRRNLNI